MHENDEDVYLSITDLTPEAAWSADLSPADHEWLRSIASLEPEQFLLSEHLTQQPTSSVDALEPILDRDLHGWRAGRYIGEIHHQGRTLRIRPRLGIDTIAQWLSAIHNVQILPDIAGRSQGSRSVVIQLAAAMWRAVVAQAGTHSLAREKVTRRSKGLQIKGKLDVASTARLRATGHPEVVSKMTHRTLVTATNAAIVAADRILNAHMGNPRWRGQRISEQLTTLRQAVGNNPRLPSKARLKSSRYTPITLKWRDAAELSHRIASNQLLNQNTHDASTYGVLIDVAELWERFVLHCAAEATAENVVHGTRATAGQYLLSSEVTPGAGMGRLYPDILIGPSADHTACGALIDAKYKPLTDPRGVDREDLYQVHAYSLSFKPAMSLLAYPLVPVPPARAENLGPWTSTAGSRLEFLRLPTNERDCIMALRSWLYSTDAEDGSRAAGRLFNITHNCPDRPS